MIGDWKFYSSMLAATAIVLALQFHSAAPARADIELNRADTPRQSEAEAAAVAAPVIEELQQKNAVQAPEQKKAPAAKTGQNEVKQKRKKDVAAGKKKQEGKVETVIVRTEPVPFLFGLFDAQKPKPVQLSQDHAKYDEAAMTLLKKKPPRIDDRFKKVAVPFSGYQPGTVVIDTKQKFLYFVQSPVAAIRYGVAVGKEGLQFTGKVAVGDKQVWPRWIPTRDMIERDPKQYARYADGMDGGPDNPLGARAIYLYLGRQDTHLRIHGTNQPNSIGSESSNGCFRMLNEHVIDLFDKVKMGAPVVVI